MEPKAIRYVYGKVFNCHCNADPHKSERFTSFISEDKTLLEFKRCPHCEAKLKYEFKQESPDQQP
jgi:NAD-dependent SIR2 family protein deacetylase